MIQQVLVSDDLGVSVAFETSLSHADSRFESMSGSVDVPQCLCSSALGSLRVGVILFLLILLLTSSIFLPQNVRAAQEALMSAQSKGLGLSPERSSGGGRPRTLGRCPSHIQISHFHLA